MSLENKSQQFYCQVCKINIATEAEYALHEFSKKHCDNLLRVAKNKPVAYKQKVAKNEVPLTVQPKEPPKINTPAATGSIAKYGYFVPGEVYDTAPDYKEFNMEYDPYLQKFAENPYKEVTTVKQVQMPELQTSVTSFKSKKRKKIRSCQICNVTLSTVPEYEAHMRSPQHSWKLKMSGMGVSAHFVKASSDLHTVEINEKSTSDEQDEVINETTVTTCNGDVEKNASVFPTLYCDICDLLLNSEQQYNAHVNGKLHNENVQKKADAKARKQMLDCPNLNQLYCFSCKVSLNNLYQYNEHKYGKKHKMKCRKLMREGITIPPEERVASWGVPKMDPSKPVVYPELYEKFVLEAQKNTADHEKITVQNSEPTGEQDKLEEKVTIPRMVFHNKNDKSGIEGGVTDVEMKNEIEKCDFTIVSITEPLRCSVCCEEFAEQQFFDSHVTKEEHARKILELKNGGKSATDILDMLYKDKTVVKPDRLGRHTCGICSVTTGNITEFSQHISSVVHKESEEDFKKKRRIEIKSMQKPNESGCFVCAICEEGCASLVAFNEHLHTVKHKDCVKADKAKRLLLKKRALLMQKRRVKQKYIISGLKRKDFAWWRRKCEKNPGVRTKIAGVATDLCTGMKECVPNLEPLEPKIDTARNVAIDVSGEDEVRRTQQQIEPLMSLKGPRPYRPRMPPRLPSLMEARPWVPYPPMQPFRYNCYPGGNRYPHPYNNYQRAPNFHPPWSRYPPFYN